MENRVILGFAGRLVPDSMAEFARHRAARLSLSLEVIELSGARLRLAVDGQPDLVDAFEQALSLGPRDSLVLDIWREGACGTRRTDG